MSWLREDVFLTSFRGAQMFALPRHRQEGRRCAACRGVLTMKQINLSIPVQVSDCGKYCNDCLIRYFDECHIFRDKRGECQTLKLKETSKGTFILRCQQCLDAEMEGSKCEN
jgi:hypothetical protein